MSTPSHVDLPEDDGCPFYCCLVGMVYNHIVGIVDDHPDDGGWPSLDWCVTLLGMVFDHPEDCWGPLFEKWVTIFWKVGDHILNGE